MGYMYYTAVDDVPFGQPHDGPNEILVLYPDELDLNQDDEDFQFLLLAHMVEDEEWDAFHGDDEVNHVPVNGWNEIPQQSTKHEFEDPLED